MPSKSTTKKNKLSSWLRNLTSRQVEWIVVSAGAALFFLMLLAAQLTRPYGSDDVAVQVIFQSWAHGLPLSGVVGSDNFILKVPFYLLEDLLMPHNSRTKLFLLVLVFAAVLFISLVVFIRRYIPESQRRANLLAPVLMFLPVAWYFAITAIPQGSATFVDISWVTNFFKLNLRNAELGVALLLMLPWARYLSSAEPLRSQRRIITGLLLAAATGVFVYSDPYFLFTLGAGVGATVVILWLSRRITNRQLIESAAYAAVVMIVYVLSKYVFAHLHYYAGQLGNLGFTPFPDLAQTLLNTGESVFKMFNADIWGLMVTSSHAKVYLVNTVLVMICTTAVFSGARRLMRELNVMRLMLLNVTLATLAIYWLTYSGTDPTQSRYVMLAVICALPLTADWLLSLARSQKHRRLVYTILTAGILCIGVNVLANLSLIRGAIARPQDAPNAINYTIIKTAEQAGAYKGYADYWDADINTYFSDRRVVFIPITCASGTITRYTWLYNLSDYDIPAHKTFFLTTHEKPGNSNGYCGDLLSPFGAPAEVININKSYTMYIYDHDIGPSIAYTPAQVVVQHQ